MDVYRRLINRDLPWAERTCASKIPYASRREARASARRGPADGSLRAYRCPLEHDHWHLGHSRRRRPATITEEPESHRRPRLVDIGLDWLSRDWWEDRRRRHLRPPRSGRPWRSAWSA